MNANDIKAHLRPRVERLTAELAAALWERLELQIDQALDAAHSALLSDLEVACPSSAATAPARARSAPRRATRSASAARASTSAATRGVEPAARRTGATSAAVAATTPPTPRAGATAGAAGPSARVPHNKGGQIVCRVCREPGHNARRHKGDAAPAAPAPKAEAPVRSRGVLVEEPSAKPASRSRRKPAAEAEAAPEPVVIPRSTLAARLAADRAVTSGGDAGGYRARPDRGAPIVGAVIGSDRREVCKLHGWVGRLVFQRDRHDLCVLPVTEPELEQDDQDDDQEAA